MAERSLHELLQLRVRLHGISLGQPVDALLDRDELKVVGLDVLCGDQVHRFLPLATAEVQADGIAVSSPLLLLEEDQLDFYRSRAFALSALSGRAVVRNGREIGVFRDLVLGTALEPIAIVVESGGRQGRYPFDDTIRISPESRSAA
jgi:hypothetical protein